MPSYTIRAVDGPTRVRNKAGNDEVFHHFEFNPNDSITSGGVAIQARRPGAQESTLVDVGTYTLDTPTHIDHVGPVSEWVFTVSSFVGAASQIHVTVTSTKTGKSKGGGIDPADKAKLDAITDTGSGKIITSAERAKIAALPFITEEDQLLEGLAFGQLYAKTANIG